VAVLLFTYSLKKTSVDHKPLETPIVAQLLRKLPTFCRTWRLVPSTQQSATEPTLSQIHFTETQTSASQMKQISNYVSLYRLLLSPLKNLPTTNVSIRLQNVSRIYKSSLFSSYNIKLQRDIQIPFKVWWLGNSVRSSTITDLNFSVVWTMLLNYAELRYERVPFPKEIKRLIAMRRVNTVWQTPLVSDTLIAKYYGMPSCECA